jgi:biotin carboxylase
LPCYATKEQIEITTDKVKFKNLCKEFEIPVVEEYKIDDIDKIVFPVLVKPADNSGARGISICYDKEQLHNAHNIALNFSESKKVIIERYIEATEATIFYTINNGKIELIGVADRYTKNNQQGVIPLPVAYIFPSKHSKKYKETLDKKAEKMFKSLEMKNGMIFIQTFVENDKFIFYEMGYRLTGSLEYKVYERINGVNSLEQMINFALTGKMEQSVKRYDKSLIGCNITLLARPGVIGKIEGVEELKSANGIIDVFASYKAGDVIAEKAKGTLMQVVVRIFATAKTMDALKRLIELTHNTIKVTSANGENMLLDKLNVEEIYE